ncbi:EcoAI/FtnUII family type I restriction enzme subunit R [Zunongwangia pacifica]|uniref:DEAD/DEAH box helicase family protein n=1 Tax=Zunongwangia pacifica TaxID=2911062 RepID=A0A9X2CR50_9FLAO|nr:type I restriction endonuclease subunit R [Zunongwangia pacifica]MCL6220923.1 DEAD/DEAH box helicase family protein [Zunongwangia pacifica]
MNEAQTEHDYIDPALKEAGWGVVEGSYIRKQYPITKGRLIGREVRERPLKADYVLQYKNTNLAVIEAKAANKYYTEGLPQAKDYAERLQLRFTYATNGLKIYQADLDEGKEGDVATFPSPQQLWEMMFPTAIEWRERLFKIPFEDRGGTWQPRYYQNNAIIKTLEAIAKGKDRILLTLATGTGKTAISFQIAWKLFQAKWNLTAKTNRYHERSPRILFLADRNILADQAFNSFNAFDEDALVRITPKDIKKKGRVPKNGSLFFTIFQSFMSGPNETPYFGEYPNDFFDFIIIDECHRGGANDESSWRAIMDYFSPAVQLGLTATPKRDVNGDTYDYFGEPVYEYSLKEGINDGFLTPFRVKEYSTTIDSYTYDPEDDVEGAIEEDKEYKEGEFNRTIEIKQREEYRVNLFMEAINQNHKTLVFCATQEHAAFIRDLINQKSKSKNSHYCHRVTADDGQRGEQHLRDFQNNEKLIPTVLTTSQKLSTGVDAPEIRNIVLLRTVNSMVEFKQIVGRGTRLFKNKAFFTIYDFVEAHKHFKDPEWDGPPLAPTIYEPKPGNDPKEVCEDCGRVNCICAKEPGEPCYVCGYEPCRCDAPKKMVKVTLSDRKVIELDSMVKTTFWSPEGKPITAQQFIKKLFNDLPALVKTEDELRKVWSMPSTRKKLLEELESKGYSDEQLDDLRKVIHGEESDLFDVLSYIAYQKNLVPRLDRAERAKIHIHSYNAEQQDFLNFVMKQYVQVGVKELDETKIKALLELRYHSIADAKEQLGDIQSIRNAFINFQQYLYSPAG